MNTKRLIFQNNDIINLLKNAKIPIGGAAVEWNNWLTSFGKLGHKAALLTYKGAKKEIKKIPSYEIVESFYLNKGIPKIRLLTYRLPSYYKAIKKFDPDYIFQACANENTGYFALIAKLLNKPFIHRIGSDMDVDGRIENNFSILSMMVYYWGVKNASHISCQNQYQYKILKEKYPQKSISVLHNPYFFKEVITKRFDERSYISWIGNFRYEKNLPLLAKVVRNCPELNFKIAGTKFRDTDADTQKGLSELEKLNNVQFLGHVDNNQITELLSGSYFLLNTSRLEGFSNTFLEAWSVGTPIVTTDNVNPDGIISNHKVGFVATGSEELVKYLKDIKKMSSSDYQIISDVCIAYLRDNHDPLKLAAKFLEDIIKEK